MYLVIHPGTCSLFAWECGQLARVSMMEGVLSLLPGVPATPGVNSDIILTQGHVLPILPVCRVAPTARLELDGHR